MGRDRCRRLVVDELEGRRLLSSAYDVLTYHDDVSRDGVQANETALTPANVGPSTFGKIGFDPADGKVDAQPLYVGNVPIPGDSGRLHNLLIVATEHDTVYAYDADTGQQIWRVTMLGPGEVPSDPVHGSQVTPEIGVTATPVIDPVTNTLYVVAMSKSVAGGTTTYIQRIHALDLETGDDKVAPKSIDSSIIFPGVGPGGNGSVVAFDPMQYKERDALLLVNGVVFTSWASHSDVAPYTGWVIGFRAGDLGLASVLNVDPNGAPNGTFLEDGSGDSFWNSGGGPASDGTFVYNIAGNGPFGTGLAPNGFPADGDYGDSFLKMTPYPGGMQVSDYFAPYNQQALAAGDLDLGSGGIALTTANGNLLAIGGGKDGNLYLINARNMGKFSPNGNLIYQEVPGAPGGPEFGTPAIFNGEVYIGGVGATLRAFRFGNGYLPGSPTSQSTDTFSYPGTTPTISANGTLNAIAWAVDGGGSPALRAYDAADLAHLLYSSDQAAGGRDALPSTSTFITPTVAGARVYVGTTTGVAVYGVLDTPPPTLVYVAGAIPNVVAGTSTTLGAYAVDPAYAESALIYNWQTIAAPPGAPSPTFVAGASGAFYLTSVTFGATGTYTLQVTISDPSYRLVRSSVTVYVIPTAQVLYIAPGAVVLNDGQSSQFITGAVDQFGALFFPAPGTVAFAVSPASGGGTIDANGLYTTPSTGTGLTTVFAASGNASTHALVAHLAAAPFAARVNFMSSPRVDPPGYVAYGAVASPSFAAFTTSSPPTPFLVAPAPPATTRASASIARARPAQSAPSASRAFSFGS